MDRQTNSKFFKNYFSPTREKENKVPHSNKRHMYFMKKTINCYEWRAKPWPMVMLGTLNKTADKNDLKQRKMSRLRCVRWSLPNLALYLNEDFD